MSGSIRKRKMMLRKLNTFFEQQGKILTEREYKAHAGVPYRLTLIQKFLGGYVRMVNYLKVYFPKWKEVEVDPKPIPVEPILSPKIDLDALNED